MMPLNGSTIRGVAFDAARTLMQPRPGLAETYQVIGCQFGSRLSPDEIGARFRTAFQTYFAPGDRSLKTDEARDERLWKQVVAGVPAEQVLMVGDDQTNDVVGARAAGLKAVWLETSQLRL